ncbi:MAG: hypothetical protein NW208_18065 [Bryobacter sp.]|nr:hypothetical protein [Bryobacter sp.]
MLAAWPRFILLILGGIYSVYLLAPAVGCIHDDGLYLVTAKSLAQGDGYKIQSLPNEMPQTKYPILYPLLLVPFWTISKELLTVNFLAKLFSFLCAMVWFWLAFGCLRNDMGLGKYSTISMLLIMACPVSIGLATSTLPDMLFSALSLGSALLVSRGFASGQAPSQKQIALAAGLASAAFLLRTIGVALIVATILWLLLHNWRRLWFYCLVLLLICGPWLLWQASNAAPNDVWELYYSKNSYAKGHALAGYTVSEIIRVCSMNLLFMLPSWVPNMMAVGAVPAVLVGFVGMLFTFWGIWILRKSAVALLGIWAVLYLGILFVWVWPPVRYFWAIVPITFGFAAIGAKGLLQNASRSFGWKHRGRYAFAAAFCLLCCGLWADVHFAYLTYQQGTPTGSSKPGESWQAYQEMAHWIRENTPKEAVLGANLDPLLYLLTERKGIRTFRQSPYHMFYAEAKPEQALGSVAELRTQLKKHKVTFVVVTPMHGFREGAFFPDLWSEFSKQHKSAVRLRYQYAEPEYAIYEVKLEAL